MERSQEELEQELLSHCPGHTLEYCNVVQSKRMPSGNLQTKCDCAKPFLTWHTDHKKKIVHIHPGGKSVCDALDMAIYGAEYAKRRVEFEH